jgi:hypothetical protein
VAIAPDKSFHWFVFKHLKNRLHHEVHQFFVQYGVGIELFCEYVIGRDHFLPQPGVFEHRPRLFHRLIGHITVDFNGFESLGLDVDGVDRIAVDQDRFLEINRFQKGVAESLDKWSVSALSRRWRRERNRC